MLLEIAAFNYHSALLAARAGADRIEICENMPEGGVTPSYGAVKKLMEQVNVPVFPMVRPRGGDFLYSPEELSVMEEDIRLFKDLGCQGVVLGLLHADGSVDTENTARLVKLAAPMEVTFHRAFDRAADPMQALEAIITTGCKRVLTSGQMPVATEGTPLLKKLVDIAAGRIIILPGCGVTSENAALILKETGAVEIHSSARKTIDSRMAYLNADLKENLQTYSMDTDDIDKMKKVLSTLKIN